jgi:hypothetical protein
VPGGKDRVLRRPEVPGTNSAWVCCGSISGHGCGWVGHVWVWRACLRGHGFARDSGFLFIHVRNRPSLEVSLDGIDNISASDHVQTAWQIVSDGSFPGSGCGMVRHGFVGLASEAEGRIAQMHHIGAELVRLVLLIAVSQRHHSALPAATLVTAAQRAVGVKVLVVRIGLPL